MKNFIGMLMLFSAFLFTHNIQAKKIRMNITPSQEIVTTGQKHTVYLKIALTGYDIEQEDRTPTNIAIVLDRSGSMSGLKILRAKDAAIMALDRLNTNDIASVVTYASNVAVIQPATKIGDKSSIFRAIRSIYPSGSTALFAGVSKGASEVRKFLSRNRINRVILLSDGRANVGPKTPYELGSLGYSLSREGISVTTIGLGLGYNEDLMTTLARRSGGNHAFVENANDLADIFQHEFNDVLSVVGQEAAFHIECPPGIRPIRILGREANINGQNVHVNINQIYSKQQKYVILEVEVPANSRDISKPLVKVTATYNNMHTKKKDSLSQQISIKYSRSKDKADKSIDNKVMSAAIEYIGVANRNRAIKLRDKGDIKAARGAMRANAIYLKKKAKRYQSKRLESFSNTQKYDADKVAGPQWNKNRKLMRKDNYKRSTQQTY